jgi:hypothetical protein
VTYAESQHNVHGSESGQTASSASWPYQSGQQTGHSSSGEYSTVNQRQGSSLGNLPMLSFLPILILVGVGALLIIPIIFLLFNMSSIGGFGGGFTGTSPFGKKRSINDSLISESKLLEMINFFSSALDNQFNKYEK